MTALPTSSAVSDTRPLADRLIEIADSWARSQQQLVTLAAEFADGHEWVLHGARTAAQWLADVADVETCTAREWIRIGRKLRDLRAIADAFAAGDISYSKVRALTRFATADNQDELLAIARESPASGLNRALALWLHRNNSPEDIDAYHQRQRSITWRTEADGMVRFSLRLPPHLAGMLIAMLTTLVMHSTRRPKSADAWPTVAQQHADALETLLTDGAGNVDTEVIIHVTGDGSTLDDGTPITATAVERIAPVSFIRALVHDAEGQPIDATNRRRHPTQRQKRFVKARDRVCVDCGRADLLEFDHRPAFERSGHTRTDELELRCAPCHRLRHAA